MNRLASSLWLLIFVLLMVNPVTAQDLIIQNGESAENAEDDALAVSKEAYLYFESDQFESAYTSFDKLCNLFDADHTDPRFEEACLYKARCKYQLSEAEASSDEKSILLQEALQLFDNNIQEFPLGRFRLDNLYWKGRSLRDLAANSEGGERERNLDEASSVFALAIPQLEGHPLKFDNSFYYALTVGEIAEGQGDLSGNNKIYSNAVLALESLVLNYPEHPQRPKAEFQLIRYLFKSQRYEETLIVCNRFQGKFPLDPKLQEVVLYHAESLYYNGRLLEAVDGYDKVIAMSGRQGEAAKKILINALYGKAWSYARLANTAGKERSLHYLGSASLALKEVLKGMPNTDPRYNAAIYKYAEALVALGNYDHATQSLQEIIDVPDYRMRANFLAGRASLILAHNTLDPEVFQEAYNHFNRSYHLAAEAANYEMLLPSLHNLVTIELSLGNYGLAVYYAQEALQHAQTIRDAVAIAKSQLNKARGLLSLVEAISMTDTKAVTETIQPPEFHSLPEYIPELMEGEEAGNTQTKLMREASEILLAGLFQPSEMMECAYTFAFTKSELKLKKVSPEKILDEAEQILKMLLLQHAVQTRLDEIYYYYGCVLFEKAKIKSIRFSESNEVLPLGKESLVIVRAFDSAQLTFQRSFTANPRGTFAARVHYAQGHVGRAAGLLFQQIADRLRKQGDRKSAQIYQEKSLKQLEDAEKSMLRNLDLIRSKADQQNTQILLGCIYQDLGRPTEAEQVFRSFLKMPETRLKLRSYATLRLADVLEDRMRIFDAVEVLSSHLASISPITNTVPTTNNAICTTLLRLAKYQEEIGELVSAHHNLMQFTRLPMSNNKRLIDKQIEGIFRAHTLGIKLAQGELTISDKPALKKVSIQGLEEIAYRYPQSQWAASALIEIAKYHLANNDYKQAFSVVDFGSEHLQMPSSQLQMNLFRGRLYLKQKNIDSSISEYQKALELHPKTIGRVKLQARTYMGLAEALMEKSDTVDGETDKKEIIFQAVEAYAAVWAKYPDEYAIADQSRIAATEALKKIGRTNEAATILGGMHDKRRSANLQRSLIDYAEDNL